jgi:hypothetical protein
LRPCGSTDCRGCRGRAAPSRRARPGGCSAGPATRCRLALDGQPCIGRPLSHPVAGSAAMFAPWDRQAASAADPGTGSGVGHRRPEVAEHEPPSQRHAVAPESWPEPARRSGHASLAIPGTLPGQILARRASGHVRGRIGGRVARSAVLRVPRRAWARLPKEPIAVYHAATRSPDVHLAASPVTSGQED